MERVRMRRGWTAWLRMASIFDLATLAIVIVEWSQLVDPIYRAGASPREMAMTVAPLVVCLVIRMAIATEWVEASSTGIAWRTIFLTHRFSWSEVIDITTGVFSFPRYGFKYVEVQLDGYSSRIARPSIANRVSHNDEFIERANALRAAACDRR